MLPFAILLMQLKMNANFSVRETNASRRRTLPKEKYRNVPELNQGKTAAATEAMARLTVVKKSNLFPVSIQNLANEFAHMDLHTISNT